MTPRIDWKPLSRRWAAPLSSDAQAAVQQKQLDLPRPLASRLDALQLRGLLDQLPAAAYLCDADGLITWFNAHAASLWGREPQLHDPQDRYCGSCRLFAADGSPIAREDCSMALALRERQEFNAREIVIERPDGVRTTVLAYARSFFTELGILQGVINILVDISDRKRADCARDEFLAMMAHELRNPLAPIRNAVQLLQLKSSATPEIGRMLELIDRQITQMTRLIDDLLDVSRLSLDKIELCKRPVQLADVVNAALETSRPAIAAAGLRLMVTLPAEPIHVVADTDRLAQTIANLLQNSARYTGVGGRIGVTIARDRDDAVVEIRDTGIGISTEMLPKVFELFVRAESASQRAQTGIGVGLAVARRLAELHGGSIIATSAGLGKGSCFVLRIPASPARDPTLDPALSLARRPGIAVEQPLSPFDAW